MLIDSYRAKNGIRILFKLDSMEDRGSLRALFLNLSSGWLTDINLRDEAWTEFRPDAPAILLRLVPREKAWQIEKSRSKELGDIFIWSRHEDGWLECAEKVAALDGPGHQYMGTGEAEIEVSFMENLRRR
jgi:hypothetical protein